MQAGEAGGWGTLLGCVPCPSRLKAGWWDSPGAPQEWWPFAPSTTLQHPTTSPCGPPSSPSPPSPGSARRARTRGSRGRGRRRGRAPFPRSAAGRRAGRDGEPSPAAGGTASSPQPSTHRRPPGVGAHHPLPAQHPGATPARFGPWGGWRRPQRWGGSASPTQSSPRRRVDNPTSQPSAGTSFHGAQQGLNTLPRTPAPPSKPCQARGQLVTEAAPFTLPGWARIRGSRWMDHTQSAAALLG